MNMDNINERISRIESDIAELKEEINMEESDFIDYNLR